MLKSWKFWAVMTAISGLAALFAFGFTTNPREVPSPLIGLPAPAFDLQQINGDGRISLADLKGTPFILNFWGSWCVACRDEARVLQEAHVLYEEQQHKVRVIGVAFQDTRTAAISFARQFGKTYFLALDSPSGELTLNYGVYGAPETFYVNAEGIIIHKTIGAVSPQEIATQVQRLTAAK